jgi:hypothetical protein
MDEATEGDGGRCRRLRTAADGSVRARAGWKKFSVPTTSVGIGVTLSSTTQHAYVEVGQVVFPTP